MSTLTICIVIAFVFGYLCIAMESLTKVNKAAVALLMFVACWTLYMFDPTQFLQLMHPDFMASAAEATGANAVLDKVTMIVQEHLGDTSTTLFFLMGAMTIVEIVDTLAPVTFPSVIFASMKASESGCFMLTESIRAPRRPSCATSRVELL